MTNKITPVVTIFVVGIACLAFFSFSSVGLSQETAVKPSGLEEPNKLMDEGNYAKAVELLTPMASSMSNEPMYYLALGRAYLGAGNFSMASTSLTTATGKKADLTDAHLRQGCSRALSKNFKGAYESMDQAAKLDTADSRIPYARCLIHMYAGEYDKALPILEQLGKATDVFGKSVAGQLTDLTKFAKEQAELADKRHKELDALKAAVDKGMTDTQDLKKQIDTALADKAQMARDYSKSKQQIIVDYQNRMNEIGRTYHSDNSGKVTMTSSPENAKAEADAQKSALAARDKANTDLDTKYKQQATDLDNKLKDLNAQYQKANGELAQNRQKFATETTKDKQYQPPWLFDVQMVLRTLPQAGVAAGTPPAAPAKTGG